MMTATIMAMFSRFITTPKSQNTIFIASQTPIAVSTMRTMVLESIVCPPKDIHGNYGIRTCTVSGQSALMQHGARKPFLPYVHISILPHYLSAANPSQKRVGVVYAAAPGAAAEGLERRPEPRVVG